MRSFIILLSVAIGVTIGGTYVVRAEVDPCAELIGASTNKSSGLIEAVRRWSSSSAVPMPDRPAGEAEFWIAKQPGVFANVRCIEDGTESQEMFPIGMVVRPLGLVDLPKFRETRGQPVLVLTEFGHRKIVSEDAFSPIIDNLTYLFADGSDPIRICREAEGCVANSMEGCGEACTQELSAFWGYAAVGSDNPDFVRAREAYIHLKAPDDMLNPLFATEAGVTAYASEVCAPFGVQTFRSGGARHYPDSPDPSHLSLCAEPAAPGQTPGLATVKMVDMRYARDRFEGLLSGSFHRRFGGKLPGLLAFSAFLEKPCGVELTDESAGNVEFSVGFDLRKVISLSGEGSISREWTRTVTVARDEQLLIQTYFMEPPFSGGDDAERPLRVFRVVSKAGCVGSSVNQPISIDIHFEGESAVATSVTIGAAREGALIQRYVSDNSASGLTPTDDPNLLHSGWFWRIQDHTAYYIWRDHLRRFLTEEVPEFDLVLRELENGRDRMLVRDFFVHLALSAAFFHDDPCTKRSVTCE